MFEEAARQHKRFEKVLEVLRLRDELARDVDRLNGVAITASLGPRCGGVVVRARGLLAASRVRFSFEVHEGKPVSLDRQLRETFAAVAPRKLAVPRAPGIPGAAGALVLLDLARGGMAAV